jgi:hypothetical protein
MGMPANDVDKMSMWQFMAQLTHYAKAHSPDEEKNKLSEAEVIELRTWIDQGPQRIVA